MARLLKTNIKERWNTTNQHPTMIEFYGLQTMRDILVHSHTGTLQFTHTLKVMKPAHRLLQNRNPSRSWKLDYAYLSIPIFQDLAWISTHVMRKIKMWDPPVPVVMPFGTTRLYYVDMLLCWTLLGFQIGCPTKYYSRGCYNTANCFCDSAHHSTQG